MSTAAPRPRHRRRAVWQGDGRVVTVVPDPPWDDLTEVVKALPGVRARGFGGS